jgi:transcriptional regulator with XRE-family HTH domain
MNTKFSKTADAAAHLAGNPKIAESVDYEIRKNTLVTNLLSMRVEKNLTQEEVAKRMNCDPSKVSRMESGNDLQLRWVDIVMYVQAVNVQMGIIFDDESLPASTRIKQCVFQIDEDLKRLARMAQQFDGDDQTAEKINRFYREVLFNFLKRFTENKQRLNNFIKIPAKKRAPLEPEGCQSPGIAPEPDCVH